MTMSAEDRYELSNRLCDDAAAAMTAATTLVSKGVNPEALLSATGTMLKTAREIAPYPSRDLDRCEARLESFLQDHVGEYDQCRDMRRLADARMECTGVNFSAGSARTLPAAQAAQALLGGLVYMMRTLSSIHRDENSHVTFMWLSGLSNRMDHMAEFAFSDRMTNEPRIDKAICELHDWIAKSTVPAWAHPGVHSNIGLTDTRQIWKDLCEFVAARCARTPTYGDEAPGSRPSR